MCLNLPQSSLDQSLERQVLQSQCRKLEAQNYNLSLTAEQLSHSMGVRFKRGELLHAVVIRGTGETHGVGGARQ